MHPQPGIESCILKAVSQEYTNTCTFDVLFLKEPLLISLCSLQSESVPGQLPELLDDMPWDGLIDNLSYMMMDKQDNLPVVLKCAKERLIRVWGTATTLEERKKTLQILKNHQNHKKV